MTSCRAEYQAIISHARMGVVLDVPAHWSSTPERTSLPPRTPPSNAAKRAVMPYEGRRRPIDVTPT
jgi:hypothetical protein